MFQHLRPAISLLLLMTLITGVAYPLATTGLAQRLFPAQAHGSLIERDGRLIGSELIAQPFVDPKYFHPRPSAAGAGYDAAASSGSNYGPTSKALQGAIAERTAALRAIHPQSLVPLELVTASASGLDPHLSPAGAEFQLARVAAARGISQAALRTLVKQKTEGRQWRIFGEPRVNVLKLNLALDALPAAASAP